MAIQRRGAASQPQRKAEDPEVSEASSAVQDEAAAIGRAATVPNSALATAWGGRVTDIMIYKNMVDLTCANAHLLFLNIQV